MTEMDRIIAALGGTTAAAALFGVTKSAVSNWKADGRFPARKRYDASRLLEARGIPASEAVFTDAPKKSAA